MKKTKTTTPTLLIIGIILVATTTPTATTVEVALAQRPPPTQTTPLAGPEVQGIIDAAHALCTERGVSEEQCLTVDYQSASLIVMHGETLLPSGSIYYGNIFLWETIDKLQPLGYRVVSTSISGVGTEANPSVIYVVLSK